EVGKVFHPVAGEDAINHLPNERLQVAGILTGNFGALGVGEKGRPVDFFTAKGIVENLLAGLGISGVNYERVEIPAMHPGRTAGIFQGTTALGFVGALHPDVEEANDLTPTYYFQLYVENLLTAKSESVVTTPSLPKFPSMERDIAVLVDVEVPAGGMLHTIRTAGGTLLESVRIFDFYQGPQVPAGKKSVAYGLVYRSAEGTLTDEEVSKQHEQVIAALKEQFGAELRA
ncbi:MAG: phenylalanine--tRNA ligase subunit beta-related protein, partial [Tumebacillaceae bacterium]